MISLISDGGTPRPAIQCLLQRAGCAQHAQIVQHVIVQIEKPSVRASYGYADAGDVALADLVLERLPS